MIEKQASINMKMKKKEESSTKKEVKQKKKKRAPSTSIPKRNFRWVTPVRSKDFSEKEAKARKQGFQAKIWMQKACVRPGFFKLISNGIKSS